jgi:hypothetical protein
MGGSDALALAAAGHSTAALLGNHPGWQLRGSKHVIVSRLRGIHGCHLTPLLAFNLFVIVKLRYRGVSNHLKPHEGKNVFYAKDFRDKLSTPHDSNPLFNFATPIPNNRMIEKTILA